MKHYLFNKFFNCEMFSEIVTSLNLLHQYKRVEHDKMSEMLK